MFHLGVSAPQEDAKRASGLNIMGWQRFLILTRQEARACVEANPNIQWTYYTANEKHRVVDNVNAALEKDGVGTLTPDIINWRMTKVVRDTLRTRKYAREVVHDNSTKPADEATGCTPIHTHVDSAVVINTPPQASRGRAFDPIRDI